MAALIMHTEYYETPNYENEKQKKSKMIWLCESLPLPVFQRLSLRVKIFIITKIPLTN